LRLKCLSCGKIIETIPIKCGYNIVVNNETNQWGCYMENCGIQTFDEFLCENCCIYRNIMNINKTIEQLGVENEEFNGELEQFKKQVVQTNLNNSDLKYWVEFGGGEFKCGKGEIDDPTIIVTCPQKIMNQFLSGNLDIYKAFLSGDLKIEGDLQYAVVYFDLLKLALEINKEIGGISL
jgi:putative sterol carrier protein